MKQGRITSKVKKEFDDFDQAKRAINPKSNTKKSSKNWKNNLFDDEDDYTDDDYLSEYDDYSDEEE